MSNVLVILAPGFEEVEALTAVDVLRRADIPVQTCALGDNAVVPAEISVDRGQRNSRLDGYVFSLCRLQRNLIRNKTVKNPLSLGE